MKSLLILTVLLLSSLQSCLYPTAIYSTRQTSTDNATCDHQSDIVEEISTEGYEVNCNPHFEPVSGSGHPIWGWTDRNNKTVWLWPEHWDMSDTDTRIALYHELYHVLDDNNNDDEIAAAVYSWCREPIDGGAYLLQYRPTEANCASLGV